MLTISTLDLSRIRGGDGTDSGFRFEGSGKSTKSDCFAKIGRGIAHGYDMTGPWKPISAMRPAEHLILDKQRNEAGAATWSNGTCHVAIY